MNASAATCAMAGWIGVLTACSGNPSGASDPSEDDENDGGSPNRDCAQMQMDVVFGEGLSLYPRPIGGCQRECSTSFCTPDGCVQVYTDYITCCALPQLSEIWIEQGERRTRVEMERPDRVDGGRVQVPLAAIDGSGSAAFIVLNGCWGSARAELILRPSLQGPTLTEVPQADGGVAYDVVFGADAEFGQSYRYNEITGTCCPAQTEGLTVGLGAAVAGAVDDGIVETVAGPLHFWRTSGRVVTPRQAEP